MRVLTIAGAAIVVAGLAALPAQAQRIQGGMGAPPTVLQSDGLSRDNAAQRRIRMEVKALRDELVAVRKANGGVIPESERQRLQARYNELRKAFRRAG